MEECYQKYNTYSQDWLDFFYVSDGVQVLTIDVRKPFLCGPLSHHFVDFFLSSIAKSHEAPVSTRCDGQPGTAEDLTCSVHFILGVRA